MDIIPRLPSQLLNAGGGAKFIDESTAREICNGFLVRKDVKTPKCGARDTSSSIPQNVWAYVLECYHQYPDFYLDEVVELVEAKYPVTIAVSTLCAALVTADLSVKILKQMSSSRDLHERVRESNDSGS